MEVSKVITNSLKIVGNEGNKYTLHFGFEKVKDEESYICYERVYAVKPTLNLANKHIRQLNPEYCITEEEWNNNEGHIIEG